MKTPLANATAGSGLGVAVAWAWNIGFPNAQMPAEVAAAVAPLVGAAFSYLSQWLPRPEGE